MQRIYIALALALCASSVVAQVPATTFWSKPPVQVIQNNDTNYTNYTGNSLSLASANPGELDLLSTNTTSSATPNQVTWTTFWRVINAKALSTSGNATSLTYILPSYVMYTNGYAVSIIAENSTTTNFVSLNVYQTPLTAGGQLGKITLYTANVTGTTIVLGNVTQIGKVVYPFYYVGGNTIRFTSFTVGGAANATDNVLTTAGDAKSLQVVWGESLGSSQILAFWTQNSTAYDAVISVSKGTFTAAPVIGVTASHTCLAFATDKTLYGELCWNYTTNASSSANNTFTTYVKTNSTGLSRAISTYNASLTNVTSLLPYAGYLSVWFTNPQQAGVATTTCGYEIWDVSSLTPFNSSARKDFITYNGTVGFSQFRVPAGPVYGLVYNINTTGGIVTYNSVGVGAILAGSYLTTILGFVMTIVAGLFLF